METFLQANILWSIIILIIAGIGIAIINFNEEQKGTKLGLLFFISRMISIIATASLFLSMITVIALQNSVISVSNWGWATINYYLALILLCISLILYVAGKSKKRNWK